jgi:hypothetical protein
MKLNSNLETLWTVQLGTEEDYLKLKKINMNGELYYASKNKSNIINVINSKGESEPLSVSKIFSQNQQLIKELFSKPNMNNNMNVIIDKDMLIFTKGGQK